MSAKQYVLPLVTLRTHALPPVDQPESERTTCPECGQQCWISAKKREIRDAANGHPSVLIACWDCIAQKAIKDPEWRNANIETKSI